MHGDLTGNGLDVRAGILALSDGYLESYRPLADVARELQGRPDTPEREAEVAVLYSEISRVSHDQALEMSRYTASGGQGDLGSVLRTGRFHHEVILQSAFIRHALHKPRGYAGDLDLMLMICDLPDIGDTLFARLLNRVCLDLPASEAVRERVRLLAGILGELPADAKVLDLACGPAVEVQRIAGDLSRNIHFDLVDHDKQSLAYLHGRLAGPNYRTLQGNAFRLMTGDRSVIEHRPDKNANGAGVGVASAMILQPEYDFIYASGLYDYLPDDGARQLTGQLFELLKPGGRLMIGNFLSASPSNPHLPHHRLMMEFYSDWKLKYRSSSQIAVLSNGLPRGSFRFEIINEYGRPVERSRGAIGFLDIRRRS